MKTSKYLKYSIWDYVLCILMTVGLTINVFQAFYLPAGLAANIIWLFVLVSSIFLILFLCGYSKRTIAISIVVFIILTIFTLIYIKKSEIFAIISTDPEANSHMYYAIVAIFAFPVFLLSRSRIGTALLFILGTYVLTVVVFLGYEHFLWGFLLFLWASATMWAYKTYQHNAFHTMTAKTSFASFFAIAGLLMALTLGLGFAIYIAQIEPLDLPTRELKLITRLQSLEILEKTGVSSKRILIDPDQSTRLTDDTKRTSQQEEKEAEDLQTDVESPQPDQILPDIQIDRIDPEDNRRELYAVRYTQRFPGFYYLIILIPLIIVAIIWSKFCLRRHWYRKNLQKSRKNQIIDFYHYYMKKFKWLGLEKRESDTPLEYVNRSGQRLKRFTQGGVDMEHLTDIYIKTNYGDMEVSDGEYESYISFHQGFYRNCRTYLGSFRYALRFFVL
jgi:hypothetical protein